MRTRDSGAGLTDGNRLGLEDDFADILGVF